MVLNVIDQVACDKLHRVFIALQISSSAYKWCINDSCKSEINRNYLSIIITKKALYRQDVFGERIPSQKV
jgi:hypothetical protein